MKKTNRLRQSLRNAALSLVVLMSGACGVEAGNPDSKGDKLFRIYVSPTSYPDVGMVSVAVDSVNLIQAGKSVSKNYQAQKLDLLTSAGQNNEDSSLALSLELDEPKTELQRVELLLANDNPYLQVKLNSQALPVKAAVISENGEISRSLIFNGQTKDGGTSDIVVDIELRKSLKPITLEQQTQLNLPKDVNFVIQQKHSFLEFSEAGSIGFSEFEPGSLVCVSVGQAIPTASADACTAKGFKSQIISERGTATISALVAGEYQAVNITRDNRVVDLKAVNVTAGQKAILRGR